MLIPLLILIALADACTYTNNDGKIFTLTSTAAWSGFIDQNQTWQLSTCAPITSGHYCWGSLVCQTWGDGDFGAVIFANGPSTTYDERETIFKFRVRATLPESIMSIRSIQTSSSQCGVVDLFCNKDSSYISSLSKSPISSCWAISWFLPDVCQQSSLVNPFVFSGALVSVDYQSKLIRMKHYSTNNATAAIISVDQIKTDKYYWSFYTNNTFYYYDPALTPSCRISNDPILPYVPNLLASRNTSSNTTESCSYNGKTGTLITYDVMKVCRIGERVLYYSGADFVANMTVFVSPFTDHGQFTFNLPYPCASLLW
ncbi:hypothetical protein PROFUN_13779 [Planoprotostelium fungivorum]|uniref:Uncharacterized protein n=1 Tax=Planoprotostelium fungivorum TaxID=1890364 RepID=A0A2P6N275_9EUKA|nr:hypothetical protein PROFUN_13779 [Planoprotostelium fungivorum]